VGGESFAIKILGMLICFELSPDLVTPTLTPGTHRKGLKIS